MISKSIIKQLFKSNFFIISLFTAILAMYQTILISMYSPSLIDQMTEMAEGMGTMGSMKGMDKLTGGYSGYIAQFYYGMIIPMFTLVYNIIMGNKVIASRVDKGSMASLLATPNTRNTISISSGLFLILSNIVIIGINFIIGLLATIINKSADISMKHFFILNLGAIVLVLCVSSISYFFSCMFNESKRSLALGGGIPILFFLFYMISDMGEKLEVFKKITIYSLFMPDKIVQNDYTPAIIGLSVLSAIALVLYISGVQIFNKKDLPV